ncbi:MAG: site-specific integrase [Treponema sp.]|nr:site-specific integrase [Treponema sp.]
MAKKGKAASGDGSIRKRPDGRWECRISINDPATGKTSRRSFYGSTQKEVREAKTALLRSIDEKNYIKPQQLTLEAWSENWIADYVAVNLKPLTLDAYRSVLRRHILPQLGKLKVQAITPAQVQGFYAKMVKDGLSPKTVRNVAAILSKCLTAAVKQGIISFSPCSRAELPKIKKTEITPLRDAEVPMFLKAISGMEEENLFALCLFCGLREGEAMGLAWDAIDFETGKIFIKQQLIKRREAGGQYELQDSTKNGRDRVIDAPPIALDYLKRERAKQSANRLKLGDAWENENNLVFTDPLGRNLKQPNIYKHFKTAAASIGRPDLRIHDLRHSCATLALASGANLKSVQTLLGHSTAAFTLAIYSHATEEMQHDTSARIQAYFENLDLGKRA